MQIHLVIPGLIWPSAQAGRPAAGLELPALASLLGRGKRRAVAFEPLDRQLARLFGSQAGILPLAAWRRLGEGDGADPEAEVGDCDWICADPVNLSFAREHMLLAEFPPDEISAAEAEELAASINDTFADLGRFEVCTPTRWYLRLARPTRVSLFPLHDVVGRPVKHFLPEGEDARLWQRTMNEVQIVLHNHPLNQARESAGRRAINSLWFWGAGALDRSVRAPLPSVQSVDPVTRGLARAAGARIAPPDLRAALQDDTLVVLDTVLRPTLQLDLEAWRRALDDLEHQWFAPLAEALGRGDLTGLVITAPGDRATLRLEAGRYDQWRFWRKPLAFDEFLRSLAPAPATATEQPPQ